MEKRVPENKIKEGNFDKITEAVVVVVLKHYQIMASSSAMLSSSLLPARAPTGNRQDGRLCLFQIGSVRANNSRARVPFRVQAAKLPAGVHCLSSSNL